MDVTTWHVDTDVSGLPAVFESGLFSDLTICLEDGTRIHAHRVLLAAASEVLKAKFSGCFCDSSENTWSPGVGSARAWQWILGWIYCRAEALPQDLFIELLVLADHFQIDALVKGIQALPRQNMKAVLALQLLHVFALPDVLNEIAAECVPAVAIDLTLLGKLRGAHSANVVLFVKCLPPLSGADTLVLLGASLRRKRRNDGECKEFPSVFLSVVPWLTFPAAVLDAGMAGDLKHFEQILGVPMCVSEEQLKDVMRLALVQRCELFEQKRSFTGGLSYVPFCVPSPDRVLPGVFEKLREAGEHQPKVVLSSPCPDGAIDADLLVVVNARERLSTRNQSLTNQPWIEIKTEGVAIKPHSVGLRHGWSSGNNYYYSRSFVVEAAFVDESWHTLFEIKHEPFLPAVGTVFQISDDAASNKFFDRFRIRMTGPNSHGNWQLFVSWFDIFGMATSRLQGLNANASL